MPTQKKSTHEANPEARTVEIIGFEQGEYPYAERLQRDIYEKEKVALQVELLKAQHWVQETGQKVVMLFEGRDAATLENHSYLISDNFKRSGSRKRTPPLIRYMGKNAFQKPMMISLRLWSIALMRSHNLPFSET